MKIEVALRRLADLELSLADLYAWYSDVFASDPEAVYVFIKMAREERAHYRLIDFHRRLLVRDQKLSVEVDLELGEIQALVARAKALRSAKTPPTLAEAMRETIAMEASAADSLYRDALFEQHPEVVRLLGALGAEERAHVERIRSMARRRGVALPEMVTA